jgi:hypothetical protein
MWIWHYSIIHPLIYSILESTDLFTLSWDLFLPYNDNITIYVKLTFILPYSSNGKVDNETQNRCTYNTGNCYSTYNSRGIQRLMTINQYWNGNLVGGWDLYILTVFYFVFHKAYYENLQMTTMHTNRKVISLEKKYSDIYRWLRL